jgi:hypothetical protein
MVALYIPLGLSWWKRVFIIILELDLKKILETFLNKIKNLIYIYFLALEIITCLILIIIK